MAGLPINRKVKVEPLTSAVTDNDRIQLVGNNEVRSYALFNRLSFQDSRAGRAFESGDEVPGYVPLINQWFKVIYDTSKHHKRLHLVLFSAYQPDGRFANRGDVDYRGAEGSQWINPLDVVGGDSNEGNLYSASGSADRLITRGVRGDIDAIIANTTNWLRQTSEYPFASLNWHFFDDTDNLVGASPLAQQRDSSNRPIGLGLTNPELSGRGVAPLAAANRRRAYEFGAINAADSLSEPVKILSWKRNSNILNFGFIQYGDLRKGRVSNNGTDLVYSFVESNVLAVSYLLNYGLSPPNSDYFDETLSETHIGELDGSGIDLPDYQPAGVGIIQASWTIDIATNSDLSDASQVSEREDVSISENKYDYQKGHYATYKGIILPERTGAYLITNQGRRDADGTVQPNFPVSSPEGISDKEFVVSMRTQVINTSTGIAEQELDIEQLNGSLFADQIFKYNGVKYRIFEIEQFGEGKFRAKSRVDLVQQGRGG